MAEQAHRYQSVPEPSSGTETFVQRVTKKRSRCLCVACIFILLLLFAALTLLVVLLLVVGNQSPVVETSCGSVEGDFDTPNNVFVFRGMPYARPPMGERRWKLPEPLSKANGSCWKGTYKAHYDPLQCVQRDGATKRAKGSEDCLYLNIYTPSIDPMTPLPVMVYIHGGYLQFGNAYTPGYTPDSYISGRLGVVFVSIQYRLNAFGYLVLDELSGTGNYGYWDQIEALRWVQENIRVFGGDPDDVTIFGQSSGGTAVQALMMTPHAKGLFHKVWSISGSPVFNKTLEAAKQQNAFFVNKTVIQEQARDLCGGKVDESCLQKIPPQHIISGIYEEWEVVHNSVDLPTRGVFEPALPVIDGVLFTDTPTNLLKQKATDKYSDVPVVIGTTAQELDVGPAPFDDVGFEFDTWDYDAFYEYVARHLDAFGETSSGEKITNKTLALYPFTNASFTFANMASDLRVTCGMDRLARDTAAAFKSPVYHYVVTAFPGYPAHVMGGPWHARYAFHTLDVFAFFQGIDELYADGASTTRGDNEFASNVQAEVMSFVRRGVMRTETWAAMPNSTALLSQSTLVVKQYNTEQCRFWEDNGFLSYAWIN